MSTVEITAQDQVDVLLNRIATSLNEHGYVAEPEDLHCLNASNNREIVAGREPFTVRVFRFIPEHGTYGAGVRWTYQLTERGAARVRALREAREDA